MVESNMISLALQCIYLKIKQILYMDYRSIYKKGVSGRKDKKLPPTPFQHHYLYTQYWTLYML